MDSKKYGQYIISLITTATTYINTVGALTALRKEAIRDSEKGKEVDLLSMTNQAYDCLPEEFKKLFCRDMLTKGDFLAESVRTIQGYFEKAVEVQKDDSGGDVNEKVDEKMKK